MVILACAFSMLQLLVTSPDPWFWALYICNEKSYES